MHRMKKCSKCAEIKNLDDFANKAKGKQSHCRVCGRKMSNDHYRRNKEYYAERNAESKTKTKEYVISYLKEHPCVDCGEADCVVLEFDHKDPTQKTASVSKLIRTSTLPRVMREIAKCEVRCANCHKRRTAKQFNWYKL